MTFEKKFAEFKKELEKRDTTSLPTDLALQVTMTDEEFGGTFYVANIDGNFAVEPYDYKDNTVNIAASADTLKQLLAGKVDAADALFSGLVSANGNLEHALAVLNLKKKPATRKTAAKKPAAKKTASKTAAKKTTTTKKTAEKKPAAKKTTTTKKAATKTAETKTAEKKTATKKTATKKAATKTAEKKTAMKKTATKKTAAKK